jgi:hypothetical protein
VADRKATVILHSDENVYLGVSDIMFEVTQTFYGEPTISEQKLDFDYKKSSKLIAVHFDEAPYEVTIPDTIHWLSYLITPEGLIMYTSINYEKDPRKTDVYITVKEDDGKDKILSLSVNQGIVPKGGSEQEANRYNWSATAKDGHFKWGADGTVNGQTYPGGSPMLVLDGQSATGWHTPNSGDTINGGGPSSLPQCLVIDMQAPRRITQMSLEGVNYLKTVKVFLTVNGTSPAGELRPAWGQPVAETKEGSTSFTIKEPTKDNPNSNFGQYLILYFEDSTSEEGKGNWISICEVRVWERPLE